MTDVVLREDFSDRWNPLLVKELRQALRGRNFSALFVIAQVVAAIVASTVIMASESDTGANLLIALGICLVVASIGVVPLFAFQAFAQEWDEHTHELLVLSQLGPGRIAWGKFQGAMLQTLLLVVSFAPYLAVCLFLEGVDALLLTLVVVSVLLGSGAAICLSLAVAGVSRNRSLRNALLGLVTVGLVFACLATIPVLVSGSITASILRTPEFWGVYTGMALVVVSAALLCFFGARAHVAHPEEAPTFPARVTTVVIAVLLPLLVYAGVIGPLGSGPHGAFVAMPLFAALSPALILFATERERLGRVALRRLRGRGRFAMLLHPLLPGGGRGLMLVPIVGALVGLAAFAGERIALASGSAVSFPGFDGWARYTAMVLYAWLYVSIASLVTSRVGERDGWRWVARLGVPVMMAVGIIGGVLLGALLGDAAMADGRHLLNPVMVFDLGGAWVRETIAKLSVVAVVLVLLNVPRWLRGFREVRRAVRGA